MTGLEKNFRVMIEAGLARRDFLASADVIQETLPQLQKGEERSDYLALLAYCYRCLGAEERFTNCQSSISYHARAKKYYLRAVRQNPHNIRHRNTVARFYLEYENRPHKSLPYLADPAGGDDETRILPEEQERLALRGAALALTGRLTQAMEHFHLAYHPKFKKVVQNPDLSPLELVLRRGVVLPREEIKSITSKVSVAEVEVCPPDPIDEDTQNLIVKCQDQFQSDCEICRRVKKDKCRRWEQAMQRYVAGLNGDPMPPLK